MGSLAFVAVRWGLLTRRRAILTSEQAQGTLSQLSRAEARVRAVVEGTPSGVVMTDRDGRIVLVNRETERLFGYSRDELAGQPVEMLLPAGLREAHTGYRSGFVSSPQMRAMGAGRDLFGLRKDGQQIPVEIGLNPLQTDEGMFVLASVVDITNRKQAEQALRDSEARFRELAENIREVFFIVDPGLDRVLYLSPAYETVFGHPRDEAFATPSRWLATVHPKDRGYMEAAREAALQSGAPGRFTFRIVRDGGEIRWIRGEVSALRNKEGVPARLVGTAEDVTDLKKTEEQFLQAQKMEGVGRLAGGVAHDFNNLLTVILGETQFALDDLPADHGSRSGLEEVYRAGERAAGLTRQLLAFSRQQVFAPTVFALNDLVADTEKMFRRMIGEDIALKTIPGPEVCLVKADRGQIEQVLMNLVVNARDAMPDGGSLVIETSSTVLDEEFAGIHSVQPGAFGVVSVTDSGAGMTDEVKARVFEPFFTTKEQGKGTGLGLATVFGIVKQSGGYVTLYSERGSGTTFRFYLPRVTTTGSATLVESSPIAARGSETILLAEDDDAVRAFTIRALQGQGYTVLEAGNAAEALMIVNGHKGPLDLLVTDVVMPGGSGADLARDVQEKRPGLKVLYVSGYTGEAAAQRKLLESGVPFLHKPFTRHDLAAKVRGTLDGGRG